MDLKQLARKQGTNLKKVAERCGIPPTTLYAISRGDTNFDNVGIGIAIKVARELGMTVEELYTGEKHDVTQPQLPSEVQELVNECSNLDSLQIGILVSTAHQFAAANERDRVDGK